MRKILTFLLIVPIFFLLIIGLIIFDYIYFPLISNKAEDVAEKFLEEKYNEDFNIEESRFSKPLGDYFGTYQILAHPVSNPTLTARISVTEDMDPLWDDYLATKWRAELNEQFGLVYEELYGSVENYSYMVNVSFPDDADSKYTSANTYEDIFKNDHNAIGNIVFLNIILNSADDMDDQLDKAFQLVQYLKEKDLEYFSVDINFYNKKPRQTVSEQDIELSYHEFTNKHFNAREFILDFSYDSRYVESKNELEQIKVSTDLKEYLR